jgi:hypothetical protein
LIPGQAEAVWFHTTSASPIGTILGGSIVVAAATKTNAIIIRLQDELLPLKTNRRLETSVTVLKQNRRI